MFFLKKILPLILLVLGIIFSSSDEYRIFHDHLQQYKEESLTFTEKKEQFSVSDIDTSSGHTLLITQKDAVLESLVLAIEQAKEHVYIQVYILTEKRLISALKDAYIRGVDVRIILEGNVFWNPRINISTKTQLENTGIPVAYADNTKYRFTHTKMMLIDGRYILATGNYSHSSFTENREFFVVGADTSLFETLKTLFFADFSKEPFFWYHPLLVFSPLDARYKITTLLESATTSIDMYAQTLSDPDIQAILVKKHQQWVRVRILLGNRKKVSSNASDFSFFETAGIPIADPSTPYIHAKSIIIDNKRAYIGSQNFTQNSLDNNREIGILLSEHEITPLREAFETDFKNAWK